MLTMLDKFINIFTQLAVEEKKKNQKSWLWTKIKQHKMEVIAFYLLTFFFGLSLLLIYILLGN